MDQPPFHLGALLLLWIASTFLARGLEGFPAELWEAWRKFRLPWAVVWVIALVGAGLALERIPGSHPVHAILLPLDAALFSAPLCFLAFLYVPRRFRGSPWMPGWALVALPPLVFAGLHIGTASWKAVLAAFAGGWLARKLPLSIQSGLHGLAWFLGSIGGIW